MRILFVCSKNKLRSPTAEAIFADYPGLEVISAGLNADSETPLSPDLVAWAEKIFVMERVHKTKIQQRFGQFVKNQRIICLDIADRYDFMEAALIELLERKVPKHLP